MQEDPYPTSPDPLLQATEPLSHRHMEQLEALRRRREEGPWKLEREPEPQADPTEEEILRFLQEWGVEDYKDDIVGELRRIRQLIAAGVVALVLFCCCVLVLAVVISAP